MQRHHLLDDIDQAEIEVEGSNDLAERFRFLLIDQRLDGMELVGIGLVVVASIGVTRTAAPEI